MMPTPAAQVAREVLNAGSDVFRLLKVHQFENDEAAHDSRQEHVEREFVAGYERALAELRVEFGEPTRYGADDGRHVDVPMSGVFRYASWAVAGRDLYLVAAREDRECPYLLVIGAGST